MNRQQRRLAKKNKKSAAKARKKIPKWLTRITDFSSPKLQEPMLMPFTVKTESGVSMSDQKKITQIIEKFKNEQATKANGKKETEKVGN